MTRVNLIHAALLGALGAGLVGCQGNRSDVPPVHLIQNMDFQKRFGSSSVILTLPFSISDLNTCVA
jgi:hypothetical protein